MKTLRLLMFRSVNEVLCFLGVAVPADDGVFRCGWSVGGFSARFLVVFDIFDVRADAVAVMGLEGR